MQPSLHVPDPAVWVCHECVSSCLCMYVKGVEDSFALISEKAKEEKVLLVPGAVFMPNSQRKIASLPTLLCMYGAQR